MKMSNYCKYQNSFTKVELKSNFFLFYVLAGYGREAIVIVEFSKIKSNFFVEFKIKKFKFNLFSTNFQVF